MNSLILFSIFIGLICVTVADLDTARKERVAAAEKCRDELNVSKADYEILYRKELPANEIQSCFLECICNKLGLFKDGKLDYSGFIKSIKVRFGEDQKELSKAEQLYSKCAPEVESASTGSEKCGAAKAMRGCVNNFSRDKHDHRDNSGSNF
uniref:Odorant binding protein n=1 Tax=Paracoccus marginatus TaxID=252483 RepID=A0AA51WDL7_9HEMI|nr:odorant binding protein [Paracoccus marginatus]